MSTPMITNKKKLSASKGGLVYLALYRQLIGSLRLSHCIEIEASMHIL